MGGGLQPEDIAPGLTTRREVPIHQFQTMVELGGNPLITRILEDVSAQLEVECPYVLCMPHTPNVVAQSSNAYIR